MVSTVIPTYNDVKYLPKTVKTLWDSKLVDEVIIVDDGSTPKNQEVLDELKSVKLMRHEENLGKAAALKTGFLQSQAEIVLFLDADLVNLTTLHIQKLLEPVIKNHWDLTIGVRQHGLDRLGRYFSFFRLFSGDRAAKREILEQNLAIFESPGFSIELSMNERCFKKVRIGFVELPNLAHEVKFKKYGWVGLLQDLKMAWQIIREVNVGEIIRQMIYAYRLPYTVSN